MKFNVASELKSNTEINKEIQPYNDDYQKNNMTGKLFTIPIFEDFS